LAEIREAVVEVITCRCYDNNFGLFLGIGIATETDCYQSDWSV